MLLVSYKKADRITHFKSEKTRNVGSAWVSGREEQQRASEVFFRSRHACVKGQNVFINDVLVSNIKICVILIKTSLYLTIVKYWYYYKLYWIYYKHKFTEDKTHAHCRDQNQIWQNYTVMRPLQLFPATSTQAYNRMRCKHRVLQSRDIKSKIKAAL